MHLFIDIWPLKESKMEILNIDKDILHVWPELVPLEPWLKIHFLINNCYLRPVIDVFC